MSGLVEEFDWIDEGVDSLNLMWEEKQRLYDEIRDCEFLESVEACEDLLARVEKAADRTAGCLEVAYARVKAGVADDDDVAWIGRAERSMSTFKRGIRFLRRRLRENASQEDRDSEERQRLALLALEQTKMIEGTKRLALKARNHEFSTQRDRDEHVRVIKLIRSRGLLPDDVIDALFDEIRSDHQGQDSGDLGGT